jgi:hypothetical protein
MALNCLAGRSYKDCTQYPVFPWVLSDYKCEKLAEASLQDLAKPMGAIGTADRTA